ncbi:WD repeat-containing protein 76 [Pseudonaja textilis]|uniref:WD repeat-containing protein 76 n=1 Tax=Pseudonaja textilis TaxID=8673 RepID=UPI000EA98E4D|nr:WD repeat-containing protein 76 [Pseudonaja textilis]
MAASSSGLRAGGAEGDEARRGGEGTPLSAYERKRLSNISENARFFASLRLFESADRLRKMTLKRKTQRIKRVKSPKAETKTTCRRSMRLQRIDPLGIPLQESEAKVESPVEEEHARLPPGPHLMVATVQEPETDTFLGMWAKISQVEGKKSEESSCNLESYKARLRRMVLREEHVAKVVASRICSVAVHPSESRTLVAAGDKWGQIGLWDLDSGLENGAYVFLPHSQAVSCLHFSPVNPAHLLSLSHDGTLRSGDVTRRVFEEVYRNESHSLSSFDFLASDASTLVVGTWDGNVAIVDRRTSVPSPEILVDLHSKTRTVHVHPVSRQYFVAAGERNVGIYDARHLKSRSQPVVALNGHSKSVASAYFSPGTGNRVVTTCADDTLRIFGTHCLSTLAPVLATIRHNNNTGRWLTRFRAVWDPKRDDCFVVGSMMRPRQIQAFHASGELLHSFLNEDYLNSVCSINSWHPTRFLVAGGNSSGRLHVFKE